MVTTFITNTATWLHRFGAVLALAIAALIFADAVKRNFFGQPIIGATEIAENAMLILVFLQVPHVLMSRKLLRVSALIERAPGPFSHLSEAAGYALGAVFFAVLVIYSWEPLVDGLSFGEFYGNVMFRIPAWLVRIPALILWGVCFVCCVTLALNLISAQRATTADEV